MAGSGAIGQFPIGQGAVEAPAFMNGIPLYDHVVIVMEENHGFSSIVGSGSAPYINNTLIAGGALLTNYFANTHPSEPNYMIIYGGSDFGITDDNFHAVPDPSLATQVQAVGKTFVGYVESGSPEKHNPWEGFPENTTVEKDFGSQFPTTTAGFTALPALSFVIPNLNNDMHDGSIATGDTWLQTHIDAYAQWAKTHNSLLIVTWDEDDSAGNNQVAAILYGDHVVTGQYGSTRYDHFNMCALLAALVGATPPRTSAVPIDGVFLVTTAPSTPTGLAASNITATSLTLSWSASTGTPPITYNILDRLANTGSFVTLVTGVSGTSTTIVGLTSSTSYDFEVVAFGIGGTSAASAPLTAATVGPSLTIAAIPSIASGASFTVSGSISGVASPPTLLTRNDSGAFGALPGGATVTTTTYSFTHPSMASGSHTVGMEFSDGTGAKTSNTFTVQAAGGGANITVGTNDTGDNTGDLIVTFVDVLGTQGVTTDGTRPVLPGTAPVGCYLIAPSISPQPGCVVTLTPPATNAQWESCSLIFQPPPHAALLWTVGALASGTGGIIGNLTGPPQRWLVSGEVDGGAGILGQANVRQAVAATVPGSATMPGALVIRALSGSSIAGAAGASGDVAVRVAGGGTSWTIIGETDGAGGLRGRAIQQAQVAATLSPAAGVSGNAVVQSAVNPQQYTLMGIVNGSAGISGSAAVGHQYFVSAKTSATASTKGGGPVPSLRVTNFVRNPRPEMNQGPTTLPTQWFCFDNSGEMPTQAIIGTGTESQIPYIDFQFAGTGAGGFAFFQTDELVFTSQGTVWSYSQFLKLQAGSLTNVSSIQLCMYTQDNNVGVGITPHLGSAITPTTAGLATQWFHFDGELLNDAGMDSFGCGLYITPGSGAFNMTLRIGGAKAEPLAASTGSQYLVVPKVGFVPGDFGSTTFVY